MTLSAHIARALVRWVSRWYEAAHRANVDGLPRLEQFFGRGGRIAERLALPIARRLDPQATGLQMVTECWWG